MSPDLIQHGLTAALAVFIWWMRRTTLERVATVASRVDEVHTLVNSQKTELENTITRLNLKILDLEHVIALLKRDIRDQSC